jgi:hypothetical protein
MFDSNGILASLLAQSSSAIESNRARASSSSSNEKKKSQTRKNKRGKGGSKKGIKSNTYFKYDLYIIFIYNAIIVKKK